MPRSSCVGSLRDSSWFHALFDSSAHAVLAKPNRRSLTIDDSKSIVLDTSRSPTLKR